MQIQSLLNEDNGVSPVIGVILMVAITVILAAVIASFVLGIGDTDDPAPTVAFDAETTNDAVVIEIESIDDSVEAGDIVFGGPAATGVIDGDAFFEHSDVGEESELSAGHVAELDLGDVTEGETLYVAYEVGDRSETLREVQVGEN